MIETGMESPANHRRLDGDQRDLRWRPSASWTSSRAACRAGARTGTAQIAAHTRDNHKQPLPQNPVLERQQGFTVPVLSQFRLWASDTAMRAVKAWSR
jgi:hypothetical protein